MAVKSGVATNRGFTMIEIMIVLLVIGILMSLAVPNFLSARSVSQTKTCLAHLRAIECAKEELATERGLGVSATFTLDANPTTGLIGTTSYIKSVPVCPNGGSYALGTVTVRPTCTSSGHVL